MQIDAVADFWNRQPCGVKRSPAAVGSAEFFWDIDINREIVGPHVAPFADYPAWSGKRVLEIGCGIGTDAIRFAENGAYYTGVDLSQHSLSLAQTRFALRGFTAKWYCGNAERLCDFLPPSRYDLVFSWGVIHHTPEPWNVVKHVKRYMGPDSEFRLMLYARHSWKAAMIAAGIDQPEAQSGCPIADLYSQEEVRELLSDFTILDMHQDHVFPYRVEDYIQHRYVLEPWFAAMPPEVFKAMEKQLGWHTLIRCRLLGN